MSAPSVDPKVRRRQIALRVAFLAALAGGLLWWSRARMPAEVALVVDLTSALPGDLRELDLIVTRAGHLLFRSDRRYGPSGAPQRERYQLRAAPGSADVEATLVYPGRPARRVSSTVELREDHPAEVSTH